MPFPPMSANPHLYDYIHDLRFRDDATVELIDGAGQLVTTLIGGTYRVHELVPGQLEITFAELVEFDPYGRERTAAESAALNQIPVSAQSRAVAIRPLADITVRCTHEVGQFPFRQEVVSRVADPQEWPCLLFTECYRFERDPLECGLENQGRNLYYRAEASERITQVRETARYYYPVRSRRELPLRELLALGLSPDAAPDQAEGSSSSG